MWGVYINPYYLSTDLRKYTLVILNPCCIHRIQNYWRYKVHKRDKLYIISVLLELYKKPSFFYNTT